jgi:hypothetical protein
VEVTRLMNALAAAACELDFTTATS